MLNIYGTIGYTVLKNIKLNNMIIILADMHDTLPTCDNQTNISNWFKTKFKSSKILLEEVPRDGIELEELWLNAPHTQELKKLFINNPQLIHAVDVRPHLIPFSWELIMKININRDVNLKHYLQDIDKFFCLKSEYIIKNLSNYNKNKLPGTKLGKHFMIIKRKYRNFLQKFINYKKSTIKQIYLKNPKVLYQINKILDEIMEWYICANIILNEIKPIILHTGLSHSEKVINWLLDHYEYIIVDKYGINKLDETSNNLTRCVKLPPYLDKQFGGFF